MMVFLLLFGFFFVYVVSGDVFPIVKNELSETLVNEFEQRSPPMSTIQQPVQNLRYPYGRYHVTDITRTKTCHPMVRPLVFGSAPSASTLKFFGVGLSRTATSSLSDFFCELGLRVIHFDHDLTNHLPHTASTFNWTGIYDDVDAVFDLPAAFYYEELASIYPQANFISIYRDPEQWFESFSSYLTLLSKRIFCSLSFPITIRFLHQTVYGSEEPNHDIWIQSYQKHYQQVKAKIATWKLLDLKFEDLKQKSIANQICTFLNLTYCPDFPYSNGKQELQQLEDKTRSCSLPAYQNVLPKSKYAYVTLLAQVNHNSFKSEFLRSAMVWCQSIKNSYLNQSHVYDVDIVVLVIGDLYLGQIELLQRCFDRLIPVEYLEQGPRGVIDSDYYAIIRSKFWTFGLIEYNRIIFMDADQMIIRNIDHYFFREYYSSSSSSSSSTSSTSSTSQHPQKKPLQVYSQLSNHSPICSAFISLEPSLQSLIDIRHLYLVGIWNNQTGWFNYGKFNFNPPSVMFTSQQSWKHGEQDVLYPEVPLFPSPNPNDAIWDQANWHFYCSWSDQGMLFYYFYLLQKEGGIVDPRDQDHEIVHFIGVHKPWIKSYQYSEKWGRVTQQWMTIAQTLNLTSDFDWTSLSLKSIIASFHTKVNQLSKRVQLGKLGKTNNYHLFNIPNQKSVQKAAFVLLDDPYGGSGGSDGTLDDIPTNDGSQSTDVDTTVATGQPTAFDGVTTVADYQQASPDVTDPTTSDAAAAGVNSNYPQQQTVSKDLTGLVGEGVIFSLHAADVPTSLSDVGEKLITEGIKATAEYVLPIAEFAAVEGIVGAATGVAVIELVPVGVVAYESYQLGHEAGAFIDHAITYVQSGQATNDANIIKQWVGKGISQIQTVFHPQASPSTPSSQSFLPIMFSVQQEPSNTSVMVKRNTTFFFRYCADWHNLTYLLNVNGTTNQTAVQSTQNTSLSFSINPSPDGMLVGVMDNEIHLASYIVRLGWRKLANATNVTQSQDMPPPPTLRLYNASWKSRVTVFSDRSQPTESNASFARSFVTYWITLLFVPLCLVYL